MTPAIPIYREGPNGQEKRCSSCEDYHPADQDHYYKDSGAKNGLSSQCKACQLGKSWDEILGSSKPEAPDTAQSGEALTLSDFMTDPQGRLVPISMVEEIDKTKDELVKKLVADAKLLQADMAKYKQDAMDEIRSFIELAAMEWEVTIGGEKGNVTLHSFDGKYKVKIQVAQNMVFDEKLQIAKKMIDECLTKWAKGSQDEIKVIINDAFRVDQEGRIDTKRILSLRRLAIKDPLWLKAMDAISSSLQVIGSKEYIRLYERGTAKGQWIPISLDMAAL